MIARLFQAALLALTLSFASVGHSAVTSGAAPDFTLRDLNGQAVTLSQLKGKVVLINFWATWCGPCMAEMPHIQKMYTELKDRGFAVLSISIDDARDRSKIKPLVVSKGLTFPVLWDDGSRVSSQYNPSGVVPLTIVVDQRGQIALIKHEYAAGEEVELRRAVESLLAAGQ